MHGQTGTHFADSHVRADSQHAPAGQVGSARLRHLNSRGFPAKIPDPPPRLHRGVQCRVIVQPGVKTAGDGQPGLECRQHIRSHRLRKHPTGGRQTHHRNTGAVGERSSQICHHRHGPGNTGDVLEPLAGMGGIDHRHNRTLPMPQHRQPGFAGEAVESTVLQQHHGILRLQHHRPSWRSMPSPGAAGTLSRSSSRQRPV